MVFRVFTGIIEENNKEKMNLIFTKQIMNWPTNLPFNMLATSRTCACEGKSENTIACTNNMCQLVDKANKAKLVSIHHHYPDFTILWHIWNWRETIDKPNNVNDINIFVIYAIFRSNENRCDLSYMKT